MKINHFQQCNTVILFIIVCNVELCVTGTAKPVLRDTCFERHCTFNATFLSKC